MHNFITLNCICQPASDIFFFAFLPFPASNSLRKPFRSITCTAAARSFRIFSCYASFCDFRRVATNESWFCSCSPALRKISQNGRQSGHRESFQPRTARPNRGRRGPVVVNLHNYFPFFDFGGGFAAALTNTPENAKSCTKTCNRRQNFFEIRARSTNFWTRTGRWAQKNRPCPLRFRSSGRGLKYLEVNFEFGVVTAFAPQRRRPRR